MIRFSAGLVVVAIGILVGGVATSKLLLVYVAIAVSAAALVTLAIGVVLKREELFGERARTSADVTAAGAMTGQPAFVGQAAAGVAAMAHGGAHGGAVGDRGGQPAFGQPSYGQPGAAGQGAGAAPAGEWPAWDADSRPKSAAQQAARGPEGARQPPPFGTQRAEIPPAAVQASGNSVPPGAWYQEPGQAPWSVPAKPDLPTRGRHAGPGRAESPRSTTSDATGPAAAGAAASAASGAAAPTAPAPVAPPAPVPPPPPAPSQRRETLSPPGDAAGAPATAEPRPATPGRTSSPGGPSGPSGPSNPGGRYTPSWFDRVGSLEPNAAGPDADAPADADRAERPASTTKASTTKDKAVGESAATAATIRSSATKASASTDAGAASASTGAASAATDDSATDQGAAVGATDDRADDVGDHGSGASVGAGSAVDDDAADDRVVDATGDVETAEAKDVATADAKGGRPKSPDAKSADPVSADTKSADADGAEVTAADAETSLDVATDSSVNSPRTDVVGDTPAHTDDPDTERASTKQVTVVPGVPRYHSANCILIRFMGDDDVQKMTVPEATSAGCTPCRACQPDTDTE